jgi:hypothetical protein
MWFAGLLAVVLVIGSVWFALTRRCNRREPESVQEAVERRYQEGHPPPEEREAMKKDLES